MSVNDQQQSDSRSAHKQKLALRRKGIYLLPNLFTTSSLFAGFYAIVAAMKGYFDVASLAIFIAMLTDMLDGRVARATNTQSAFGAEYDSLADMVAFGVAPALVVYSWSLGDLGKIGWLSSFFYTASVALRLARFNVRIGKDSKRFFYGLPSPAAAGVVAGFVGLSDQFGIVGKELDIIVAVCTLLLGLLMVSNVRFYSFKELDIKKNVPFVWIIVLILLFVLISVDPPKVLFLIFFAYALSGPLFSLYSVFCQRSAKRRRDQIQQ